MGIEIRPSGEAAATARAGQIIGAGERRKEDRARGEREQARAQQAAAQQAARKAAMEWEQQKMLFNSQQDFAHEMRMRQAQLDKEARAEEWQVEKMEIASRMDFEQEEKERLRDNAMWAAADKTITESDMPEVEKARAHFRNWQKHPNAPGAIEHSGFKETKNTEMTDVIKGLLGDTTTEVPPPGVSTPTPVQMVLVQDKDGNYGEIPANRVEAAVTEGGFTLVDETALFRSQREEELREKEQREQSLINYLTNLNTNIRF